MQTTNPPALVIVGAGHAGSELAVSARQQGWTGSIVLLSEEDVLPYHRPPLSKTYLSGEADADSIALRPTTTYEAAGVDLRLGVRVAGIDRTRRVLLLQDGASLAYDKLALCTGGRPRPLSCEGLADGPPPANLLYLRTRGDADAIRGCLHPGCLLVVIGGGYVGLEIAASARKLGSTVTVLEAQPRVLARVSGEPVSRFYEDVHRQAGVTVRTSVGVQRVECEAGRITAVHLADGTRLPADLVVAGVGMVPNIELAREAGLADDQGILVDELGRTADADIVAAGDCTVHHSVGYGRLIRLESVPNALDQARAAASWLAGNPKPNNSVPWFWSDQYDLKLQMAGLSQGYDQCVIRGSIEARKFAAFYLQGDRLLAVDAVNSPAEFLLARRALAAPAHVEAAALADTAIPLKEILR